MRLVGSGVATSSVLVVALIIVCAASAVNLDFGAANDNDHVAGNWVDSVTGDPSPSLVERSPGCRWLCGGHGDEILGLLLFCRKGKFA